MIDIIIPAYNAHKTIGRALMSILRQLNRNDIKVLIVDDGSDETYDEIIKSFSSLLDIKVKRINNSGPGKARQVGINSTENEYIVFLDADDTLYNEYSILNLLSIISNSDLAQGKYIEKTEFGEKEMEPQYCYLHGKMYRRSIIEKNKLKFEYSTIKNGDIYEDSTFNQLYCLCCDNIATTNEFIYVYEYNESSLTRKERKVSVNLYNFIKATNWLIKEVEKRTFNKKEVNIAWDFCLAMYHCYFNYMLAPEECEFVFEDMSEIKKMYCKYIDYLLFEEKLAIYKIFNYDVIPIITINDFVSKIKEE